MHHCRKKWGSFKHGNIPFYWVKVRPISGKTWDKSLEPSDVISCAKHSRSSQQTAEWLRISKQFQNITEVTTGKFSGTIISDCKDFFGRLASAERRFQYRTFCCRIVCISRYGTFYESSSKVSPFELWPARSSLKRHYDAKCTEHSTDVLDGLCLCTNLVHCRFKLSSKGKPCIDAPEVRIVLQLIQFSFFIHISMHSVWRHFTQWLLFWLRGKCRMHILGQTPTLEPIYRRLASNSRPLFV